MGRVDGVVSRAALSGGLSDRPSPFLAVPKAWPEALDWSEPVDQPVNGDKSMLEKIRALFAGDAAPPDGNEAELHLAAAFLLMKVAGSDQSFDEKELLRLRSTLQQDWQLNEADLDGLVAVARDASDSSDSLQKHIDLINLHFSPARKLDLFRSLWQAASADGRIHYREEQLIRRLADLMHVSDEEFIRSKHWVLDQQEED